MAQSRAKRNQRSKRPVQVSASPEVRRARVQRRRIVIAFLILIGLAGILAVSAPGGDGDGAPVTPERAYEPAR